MTATIYAGMIPFYLNRACGAGWCSLSDSGFATNCDFWTGWAEAPIFYPHPEFGTGSAPFTEGTNPNNGHLGLVAECAFANYPTPIYQVSTMIRTTPMADTGTGQFVFVGLENLYQLMGDALNFRCTIEICNHVDPATGRRRGATFTLNSQGPDILVSTYGIDADGVSVDLRTAFISPTIPAPELVSLTFELDSYANGVEEVIVNGGLALSSIRGTDIGESGGYQAVTMSWDVQFALCSDGYATSPVITQATGGEICDYAPPVDGGCIQVMGAATGWRRMDTDPDTYLMFYDSTNNWYRENDGVAQWQQLQWETALAGNQSVEIAVENVGSHSGAVGVTLRQVGVQGWWRDTGIEAEVYADGDGAHSLYVANPSGSLYYFADDGGFGDPTSYTLRGESDIDGAVRVYVDNVLVYSGLDPDAPYASATNVGVVMDALPPIGTPPPYDFSETSPRITYICISTSACVPEVVGSELWELGTSPFFANMLTYNASSVYYHSAPNTGGQMMWPTEYSGTQSISVTVDNFGGPEWDYVFSADYVTLNCRMTPDSGEGIALWFYRDNDHGDAGDFTGPSAGYNWSWWVEYDDGVTSYYQEATGGYLGGRFLPWPYDDGPFELRLESDPDGTFRVYEHGNLLVTDTISGIPLGPSNIGFGTDGNYAGTLDGLTADGSVDKEPGVPHISNICIIGEV